jgi:hypothetical protein
MPAAMIRDTNDGKEWSALDDALAAGDSIEQAAMFLCRAGTLGEVARKAAELHPHGTKRYFRRTMMIEFKHRLSRCRSLNAAVATDCEYCRGGLPP